MMDAALALVLFIGTCVPVASALLLAATPALHRRHVRKIARDCRCGWCDPPPVPLSVRLAPVRAWVLRHLPAAIRALWRLSP